MRALVAALASLAIALAAGPASAGSAVLAAPGSGAQANGCENPDSPNLGDCLGSFTAGFCSEFDARVVCALEAN